MKVPAKYRQMEYRDLIAEMVRLLKPHIYVEYGVKRGYTINHIAPMVERAIGVDINPVKLSPGVEFFCMPTSQFQREWQGGMIDFLFIDADHNWRAVYSDLVRSIPFFKPFETMIFMHDTYPIGTELLSPGYCGDAWKAAKRIRQWLTSFEIVTLPGPWAGLSILRYVGDGTRYGWMDNIQKEK